MYCVQQAKSDDYEFLYNLKKSAEFEAIKAVFGWDEDLQLKLHEQEWTEAKPAIIEIDGKRAGSYLMQDKGDHYYFGRFFLLPQYHSSGIGSQVLNNCITMAEANAKPLRLCCLQGNRVVNLYIRFGFTVVSEDAQFLYMERKIGC